MVEWLGHQTRNPEIPGSSPALTTWISAHQLLISYSMLVNSQLVYLLPVWILNLLSLFQEVCFIGPEKLQRAEVNLVYTAFYIGI